MKEQEVLAITDITGLRNLSRHILDHELTEAEIRHILELCDALWLHSGRKEDPHAELTSGKCSNGFVDALRALRFTNLCCLFADQLIRKLRRTQKLGMVDWVIGSDHAGAAFSHSVALLLNAQHDFTEKGPNKTQLWQRFNIGPKETVLQIEELMTTAETLQAVREGILKGNNGPVTFAPVVGVLVHRSNVYEIFDAPVVYLVHFDISTWDPKDCPLCEAGSKRLRPKKHWQELTGRKKS